MRLPHHDGNKFVSRTRWLEFHRKRATIDGLVAAAFAVGVAAIITALFTV